MRIPVVSTVSLVNEVAYMESHARTSRVGEFMTVSLSVACPCHVAWSSPAPINANTTMRSPAVPDARAFYRPLSFHTVGDFTIFRLYPPYTTVPEVNTAVWYVRYRV